LKQVTKEEKDLLIKHNILKMEMGKYLDLIVTSKRKKHRKRYYVPDFMVDRLRTMSNK